MFLTTYAAKFEETEAEVEAWRWNFFSQSHPMQSSFLSSPFSFLFLLHSHISFSSLLFPSLPSFPPLSHSKERTEKRKKKKFNFNFNFFNHQLNFLNSLNYQRWLRSRRELAGRVCKCRRRSERGLGRG